MPSNKTFRTTPTGQKSTGCSSGRLVNCQTGGIIGPAMQQVAAAPTQRTPAQPSNGSGAVATVAVELDPDIIERLLNTGRLDFSLSPGGVRCVSRDSLAAALGALLSEIGRSGASG